MARMYSRKKGQSGSKKPLNPKKLSWIRYKPKEIEMIITKLAKQNKSASEIGGILRDSYGVPSVQALINKKITQVLVEKDLTPKLPEDLMALIRRFAVIKKHMENNRKDKTALRGLQLTDSKIKRLVKYFKLTEKLPVDWKLDEQSLKLYVE